MLQLRLRVLVAALAALALGLPTALLLDHGGAGAELPDEVRLAADSPGWGVLQRLTSDTDWAAGTNAGARWKYGTLFMGPTTRRRTWDGVTYAYSQWTSPWRSPGRAFTELVPSWDATTRAGTIIAVYARARTAAGQVARWQPMGRWATYDAGFHRTSLATAPDSLGRVDVDTFKTKGPAFSSWQVSVLLMRRAGASGTPAVRSLQVMTSNVPATLPATSRPLSSTAVELPVPRYSQMIHRGQEPQYGGGGEAWCSPTSLAMVLGYYGALPPPSAYAWVPSSWPDRWVDQVARQTYDYRYQGTGNWPFNTGLAATRVPEAFVTRLPDLRQAERFVRAGIPVIASIRFASGQLSGAPISATPGHLVVIVGFTGSGDPVVNDPAASGDATVRRVYDRGQFERAWLRSGGTSYILRGPGRSLPPRPAGVRAW